MKTSQNYVNCLLWILLVPITSGTHIQFHKGDDKRSYLVFESNATSKCNNIPRKVLQQWNFVKTDTCMMVYNDFQCRSLTSGRFEPGTSFNRDFLIYSFHVCNNDEGGLQLNLDLTEYFSGWSKPSRILESYKDMCKCINIPKSVHDMKYWSLNNHGNELMAYYETDCTELFAEPTLILDGHSYDSRNIYFLKKDKRKVLSLGPAKKSSYYKTSCLKMGITTLPTVELSEATEENGKPQKGRTMDKQMTPKDIEALLQKHTEEITELNDKVRNLQQKLDHFKMNLDVMLDKQKEEFQEFTDKIKDDLQEAYVKGHEEEETDQMILTSTPQA